MQLGTEKTDIPVNSAEDIPLTNNERRAGYTAFTTGLAAPQPSYADFTILVDAWDP